MKECSDYTTPSDMEERVSDEYYDEKKNSREKKRWCNTHRYYRQ